MNLTKSTDVVHFQALPGMSAELFHRVIGLYVLDVHLSSRLKQLSSARRKVRRWGPLRRSKAGTQDSFPAPGGTRQTA